MVIKMLDSMLPKNTHTPIVLAQLAQQLPTAEEIQNELKQLMLAENVQKTLEKLTWV